MIDKRLIRKIFIKTGPKVRTLYTYSSEGKVLRKRHDEYLAFLTKHSIPSTFSHAYTKNRSIYTNAKVHMYNDIFVKIDVKNFFPSLNQSYLIQQMFYELNKPKQHSISKIECKAIIDDCSISNKGIPLGFTTSPALSNIYMKKFDGLFYGRLRSLKLEGIKYTRYADDIFISFKQTPESILPGMKYSEQIIQMCEQELNRCHLKINCQKTKVINLDKSNHVKLAGINVIKKDGNYRRLTVGRDIIKDLYFRSMRLYSTHSTSLSYENKASTDQEIKSIMGMHSYILSVYKEGYSYILSKTMQDSVKEIGYKNLEHMISKMSDKNWLSK